MHIKISLSTLVLVLLISISCSAQAAVPQGVNLASLEGWDIVICEEAIPSEVYAAEEFQNHVAKATGHKLPIVKSIDRPDCHVFIGPSKLMRDSQLGFAIDDFGDEDLRVVIRDKNIVIAGGRPRGTLYGVYTFLEDYLGVRFLTADHTHIPPVGRWREIGPVDRFYHPQISKMRYNSYGESRDDVFGTRMRDNTVSRNPKFGGRTGQRNIGHTFSRQVSPSKYGKEHPEYFCLRGGKRQTSRGSQPCLTNPDVLRLVTDAVLDEIKRSPIKRSPEVGNVCVAQNDSTSYCQCPDCAAVDKREGTHMGSLLEFVNKVADNVGKKHPDVNIGTLAFSYTRRPPQGKLKARPNVQIELCTIECCVIHPLTTKDQSCRRNISLQEDLPRWNEICDQMFIWNYNTNFHNYLLPCPNLRVLEPNIRLFAANDVKGVFMQGTTGHHCTEGEMADLRVYMTGRLLWDPTLSGEKLFNEFLDLHYGRAADPIRQFINRIHDKAEKSGLHVNCFGRLATYGLDETDAQAGLDAFAKAMDLAENDTIRTRVEKASITAHRAAIEPIWYTNWYPKDPKSIEPDMIEKMRPLVKRFFELCDKYDLERYRESEEDLEGARQRLKKAFGLAKDETF